MRNLGITDLSLTINLIFLNVSEGRNIFICHQFKTDFEKENYVLQRKPAWRKSVLTKNSMQKTRNTLVSRLLYHLVLKEHKT